MSSTSETGKRFAIVVSQFNREITQSILKMALVCFEKHGYNLTDIPIHWVPGSFEIPLIAKKLAESKKYDAIVAIGCVIRGETFHFELVATHNATGIMQAQLETGIPIIFSLLATENYEQALCRSENNPSNVGYTGALAAIEMANLITQIS